MAISGQTTVTAAGSAVALGDQQVNAALMVRALSANTGLVYIGNDGAGDVSSASGMQLEPGEGVVFDLVSSLANLRINAAVSGEGVAWLILEA
jgi:hypothetical protein